jgi:hypothetical protein
MAGIKTKPTQKSVIEFLDAVTPERKRLESYEILRLMERITGEKAVMWGPSIVGFGKYHYKYDSGHEGDMCIAAFSPRKPNMVVYLNPGFVKYSDLLGKLGKFKTSVTCLYFNRLSDIDIAVLEKLIRISIEEVRTL